MGKYKEKNRNIMTFTRCGKDFYNPLDVLNALGYKNVLSVWKDIKYHDFNDEVINVISFYKGKERMIEMTTLNGILEIFKRHNVSNSEFRNRRVDNVSILLDECFSFTIRLR